MGDKAIPEVQGGLWISAADPCNEVFFERPYGAFGGVAEVDFRGRKLVVYCIGGKVLSEDL